MATIHTESMPNKPTQPELVELALKPQVNTANSIDSLVKKIRDLKQCNERVEADVAVARNVNSKFAEQITDMEKRCQKNAQYSKREYLEVSGVPNSVSSEILEGKICEIFLKIGVDIDHSKIQACHILKKDNRTTVKFSNRKNCLESKKKC